MPLVGDPERDLGGLLAVVEVELGTGRQLLLLLERQPIEGGFSTLIDGCIHPAYGIESHLCLALRTGQMITGRTFIVAILHLLLELADVKGDERLLAFFLLRTGLY